jgi:hypothetical protein
MRFASLRYRAQGQVASAGLGGGRSAFAGNLRVAWFHCYGEAFTPVGSDIDPSVSGDP